MDTGAEVAKRFYKELTDIQVHYYDYAQYYSYIYQVLNFSIYHDFCYSNRIFHLYGNYSIIMIIHDQVI